VVEPSAAWERAGLAQIGELDASTADDAADFGVPQFLPKSWQFPLRDGQEQRVVFAAAECKLHAVGKTAGCFSQRKRAAFDDGADAALLADVAEILEEAVADVDGRRCMTRGQQTLADSRNRTTLRARRDR
jgi:hypothetical protein